MRALVAFALLLPSPALADVITAPGKIARVTLYPWGASVVRQVEVTLPEGAHEVIVPGLPLYTTAEALRVEAPEGTTIGAVSLQTGRLPPVEDEPSAAVKAAEDEVERLETVLRDKDAAIAAIRLKATAAQEQIAFLRAAGMAGGDTRLSPDELRAMAQMVSAETLAALQAAHQAEEEARTAERAREDDVEALDKARAALAALTTPDTDHAALSLAVQGNGQRTVIEVTTFTDAASWQPVYDLRLTTGDAPKLVVERGVQITQASGEDWRGVELTMSTARPSGQTDPGELWPELRQIGEPQPTSPEPLARTENEAAGYSADMFVAAPAAVVAEAAVEYQGATVTYRYDGAVDVLDGVQALRLKLGDVALDPKVLAVAIPRYHSQAFLMADIDASGDEILLPGQAMLYRDGALVGMTQLPMVAAGSEMKIGFGEIDGLALTREMPERSEGDSGLISKSTTLTESALLKVENLTGQAWDVRVIDQVPYSEQEDLVIAHQATPPETTADRDGKRGILEWDFKAEPGSKTEIRLDYEMSWPAGMVLR